MTNNIVTVLIVEDDKVDAMALRRSFQDLKLGHHIIEAHDGIEALQRLRGENGFDKLPSPCLILLDLNMPRMGGLEFLDIIRADTVLSRSLVFVMTSSAAEEDRMRAYDKNIVGFVPKYRAGQTFRESIRMVDSYCQMIEFPP